MRRLRQAWIDTTQIVDEKSSNKVVEYIVTRTKIYRWSAELVFARKTMHYKLCLTVKRVRIIYFDVKYQR